jgi:hypothetical protein
VRDRAITVSVPATDVSVVSLGTQFIVASCDDKGRLTVSTVPASAALLPVLGPPVVTPPEPPVPVTTRATIESWETPVKVGQPSRAVAKVTSGKPGQFRWSWGDKSGTWHVGALNVGTDLDHSFNRPNGVFDNVPPGPGKYPIRLETLVAGKVVDTTGTLRLLEVLADDVPPIEPPPVITPPPGGGTVRAGLVRADGKRHFQDDHGRFWPLGETLFWAMHGWKYERDRLKQNIDYVAKYDFDYLRILAQVGWAGNEISESWSDHVQILDELLDYAWGKGLRLQITCIGGGGNFNPDQVVTNVITAAAGHAQAVHSVEVANEWFATFKDEAKM